MSDKYVDINSLEKDYSMQQAIEDGCFIIEKNEIISDNKSQLDNFIDKCNQNVESNIRICDYQYGGRLSIIDIDYNNGRINSCCKCFDKENIQMYYNSGNKITKMVVFPNDDKNKSTEYYIIDEIGNQKIIYIIK